MRILITMAVILMSATLTAAQQRPVPVIFDTDMGNDIDDALALAMLHAMESSGEAKIVAVTVTKAPAQRGGHSRSR